jgi:ABC-type Fe3+ transport system substrate-binding protein
MVLNPTLHPNATKVFVNWLLSRAGQAGVERVLTYPSLRIDTPTKSLLPELLVPEKGTEFMFVSLEKYWHLDNEIHQLLKSLKK